MRSTVIESRKNIFERFGGYIFENDHEASICILGMVGTILSAIGIIISIVDSEVPIEVTYASAVFGIPSLIILAWAIFGFKAVNGLVKYATADEISFNRSKWNPDNYDWDGGEVYVTVMPVAFLAAVVPIITYHMWFIMAPVLTVVGLGWGVIYASRRAFTLNKRLNQHVSDPNAHKNTEQSDNHFDKAA